MGRRVRASGMIAFVAGLAATCNAALSQDDFPIVGTYVQKHPCRGDGSDPQPLIVRITPTEIAYGGGLCSIDNTRRDGNKFSLHVRCKFKSGNVLASDITLTVRDDKTVDMTQREGTYKAVLNRCPG